jgi:hypothetical protein
MGSGQMVIPYFFLNLGKEFLMISTMMKLKTLTINREMDFGMLFIPQYQNTIADINKDIQDCMEELMIYEATENQLALACSKEQLSILKVILQQYKSLVQKNLN